MKFFIALAFVALAAAIARAAALPQFPAPSVTAITPSTVPAGWEGRIVLTGANFARGTMVRLNCSYRTMAVRNLAVESPERMAFDLQVPADLEPSRCVMLLEVSPPNAAETGPTVQGTPQIIQVIGPSLSIYPSASGPVIPSSCGENLLPFADPARDAINGKWTYENGALISDGTAAARLSLPAVPPDEYDFRVDFTRLSGTGSVVVILARGAHRFVLEVGGWDGIAGLALVNGRNVDTNPTKIRFPLTNGQRYSVVIRVRDSGLEAVMDGRAKISFPTDYRNLTLNPDWSLPGKPGLGIGSFASPTRFHLAELAPSPCGAGGPEAAGPIAETPSAPEATTAGGLLIEALVDGDSDLHITPEGIFWVSGNSSKPGRHLGRNEATYVNGTPWFPDWQSPAATGPDKSAIYPIRLPLENLKNLQLESVGANRGSSGIQKRKPLSMVRQDNEIVIRIPDPEAGSRWYRFRIVP